MDLAGFNVTHKCPQPTPKTPRATADVNPTIAATSSIKHTRRLTGKCNTTFKFLHLQEIVAGYIFPAVCLCVIVCV